MTTSDESERISLGDLVRLKATDDQEMLNVVVEDLDDSDIKPKRKPKAKSAINFPLPQTPGQWLMIAIVAVFVFILAGIFFWIFPTRTVEVYIVPTVPIIPTAPAGSPPSRDPLYAIDQPVQVFNLTPDVAGYQDWWVLHQQWLPVEGEWIYEVRTYDGITLMRAENQLAPRPPTMMPTLIPSPIG